VNLKRFKFTLRKYSVPLGTGGKASNEFQLQATALEAIILVKEDRPPTRRRNVVESFNREPSAEFSSYLLRLLKQWTSGGVVDDEEVPCGDVRIKLNREDDYVAYGSKYSAPSGTEARPGGKD
jgi:hypothetical protein